MGADIVVFVSFHLLLLLHLLERGVLCAILVLGPRVRPRHATIPPQASLRYIYTLSILVTGNSILIINVKRQKIFILINLHTTLTIYISSSSISTHYLYYLQPILLYIQSIYTHYLQYLQPILLYIYRVSILSTAHSPLYLHTIYAIYPGDSPAPTINIYRLESPRQWQEAAVVTQAG